MGTPRDATAPGPIDVELAAATAQRLCRRGPAIGLTDLVTASQQLAELAVEAEGHVSAYTGLTPPVQGRAAVAVLDRGEWARAAVLGVARIAGPALARVAQRRAASGPGARLQAAATRRVAAAQTGAAVAWLSAKVLGQYEIPAQGEPGRLLLVAPNILAAEQTLGVPVRDFRLWVCLHEETHRVQFEAVPWLAGYLLEQIGVVLDAVELDAATLAGRVRAAISSRDGSGGGLLALLTTAEQRAALDRLQALMTLLEGHADQVMDAVGPQVVPTVAEIRRRFEARRGQGGPVDRVVRRLLGVDAKIEQYRTGGRFVRRVVSEVGVGGFSAVWGGPEWLPTRAELGSPAGWLARVHGVPVRPA